MKSIYTKFIGLISCAAMLFSSCTNDQVDDFFKKFIKAPASSIERDVKGHDQIYAVHAILRMGYKGGLIGVGPNGTDSVLAYNTYHVIGDTTSIPIMQEIDIAKDDDGQMTVTTERDHFDVVASDDIYYGLELKYYDQNGMLINHQFSGYPFMKDKDGVNVPDENNSTLLVHQHFFGIGNSSLNKEAKDTGSGQKSMQLAYPRSLDERPTYYDRYTFREKGGSPEPATKFSASNIFAPEGFTLGQNKVVYDTELAWKSIELSGKPEALLPYTAKDGKTYRLYRTIDLMKLNKITPEIFTYEYRDTDPVEEELGKLFVDSYNDDFIDPDTDAPRQRYGETVGFLRQNRSLDKGTERDRLGFKGLLQFHKADLAFQLQVKICHILNKGQQYVGEPEKPAKYCNTNNSENGYLWDFNQIQPGWDSFDIDYPIPVRVIANAKDGAEKCYRDVKRFYPNVNKDQLWQMLSAPGSFFRQYRRNIVLM
ncbi:hypothetical protein [Hoylesella pleuritidis]|uniref:hypothetical protein n=1 Tax=Hoylesella pleuritidis TaxID=407975 RepID=UPI0028E3A37D|nr:hypothetical protein [Hoylesella pleuritidis]